MTLARSLDATGSILREIPFSELSGWREDDHGAALRAFLVGARLIVATAPKTRALGIDGERLRDIAKAALGVATPIDSSAARAFFERHFVPHKFEEGGFVTGYYEPEVEASRTRTERFRVPLYRRPHDLVDVSDANRPATWNPEIRFARRTERGLELFFDRRAIEAGALSGRGLELAFLESTVDAYFIHVQGSARLRLVEGGAVRIAFDGKSGHAYTSIGRLAVERGILSYEAAHKDGLEAWLKKNPKEGSALMRENRSFIFFRATELAEHEGPMGAAGVPLTVLRSLAVDRTLHTFHTPIWVDAPGVEDPERQGLSFRRLMIAQDAGSAIVGAARGDIFFGSGARGGSLAGRIRHHASMIALVPKRARDVE